VDSILFVCLGIDCVFVLCSFLSSTILLDDSLVNVGISLAILQEQLLGPFSAFCCFPCLAVAVHYRYSVHPSFPAQYEVIYSNIEGPLLVTGHGSSRYFVTFIDACTKESKI
jgi:hypothetical protein